MRKIENFAQISDLLNAQLKKGVITNNFLRGDDYTREIENGLYIHEADGALLLFRERGIRYRQVKRLFGFLHLYFNSNPFTAFL